MPQARDLSLNGTGIEDRVRSPSGSEETPDTDSTSAVIANNGTLSNAVHVPDGEIVRGILTASAWTAASLTFDVSVDDGVNYFSLAYPDGSEFIVTPSTTIARFVPFPTVVGVSHIKARSGISGTTTAQGAERTLKFVIG